MGRTSDAREKILRAGQALVGRRGYSALGVAEICSAAGVPKGSFYHFFASKEALALAVIDEHWQAQERGWQRILSGPEPPLHRLRALCEDTQAAQRSGQQGGGAVTGCLLGNLTLELSNQAEVIRARLQEVFDAQAAMVAAVITQAQARGEVTAADPVQSARALVAQLEGQVLLAKLYNDAGRLGSLWDSCAALLGAQAAVA